MRLTCGHRGVLPVAKIHQHERQTQGLRYTTDAPAGWLHSAPIAARIAAESAITATSSVVKVSLDAREEWPRYSYTRLDEAAEAGAKGRDGGQNHPERDRPSCASTKHTSRDVSSMQPAHQVVNQPWPSADTKRGALATLPWYPCTKPT